jgi:hypothetical protein
VTRGRPHGLVGEHASRGRRKGRSVVANKIQRAVAGGPNDLLPVLRMGGHPPRSLLSLDPWTATAAAMGLMAEAPTVAAMDRAGASALGVLALALRSPGAPEDAGARRALETYLRACWRYGDEERIQAQPRLSDGLSEPALVRSAAAMHRAERRAARFAAFADLALKLAMTSPDWRARLRLCEVPACPRYFLVRDPAGARRTCSNRCRQAAFRARLRSVTGGRRSSIPG